MCVLPYGESCYPTFGVTLRWESVKDGVRRLGGNERVDSSAITASRVGGIVCTY